jgi:hypothetical protein
MKQLATGCFVFLLGLWGCTNCPSNDAKSERLRWEYKILRAESIGESEMKARTKLFNDLADDGWEYAGSYKPGGGDTAFELVFRRLRVHP